MRAFTGRELRAATPAQDPVNQPMIRHWTEAMGDTNPVYTDAGSARATGRDGVVAPASMVQAWTMPGYAATVSPPAVRSGFDELVGLLAEGGYTSVVATDSEFGFLRELVPGDHVTVRETVESISEEKRTGLGAGRFVTTLKTYTDQHGETVATQRWRTLRFRPASAAAREEGPEAAPVAAPAAGAAQAPATAPAMAPATAPAVAGAGGTDSAAAGEPAPEAARALRPRPAVNRDNAFFFDGAKQHRLLIQRCTACSLLRHPPGPCCPECNSLEWDTVEASGRGVVHSFVVNHHPRHPAFDFPMAVAVVALAEGTRLIAGLTGVAPEDVEIDMPVVLDWLDADPDLTLPVFRPAPTEAP
nr:MaoC family dehydratase N-terminal domain-containing protein [Streptomyces sp. SID10853]